MKINFFSQHFMLFVRDIEKVNGARSKYPVLIYETWDQWEEIAMVGRMERTHFNFLTHTEVFL
jgi:hypothetical protein